MHRLCYSFTASEEMLEMLDICQILLQRRALLRVHHTFRVAETCNVLISYRNCFNGFLASSLPL